MKKLIASVMALTLGTSAVMAGGPIVVEEEAEVVAEESRGIGILPLVIGAVILCAVVCGGDDDEENF